MRQTLKRATIALAASGVLYAGAAPAADDCARLDPQADALLKKMSEFMASLESFTVDAYVTDEQIMDDGFKLQSLRSGSIAVQRPNRFHVVRKGVDADHEVFFDGMKLTAVDKGRKLHVQVEVKGTIDDALDAAADVFGAELPARDLLSPDAYTPLMEAVQESAYLEPVQIGAMTCRQLAFRSDEVDWQIWIQEGDQPLPCRYVITSKWTYGAPNYAITFANWQVNPKLAPETFEAATEGSKGVDVESYRKAAAK
jgi:hypothetical protein